MNDLSHLHNRVDLLNKLTSHVEVDPTTGCWLWQRATNGDRERPGYGVIRFEKQKLYVHRAVWAVLHGAIPEAMEVRHSCDVSTCLAPDHLSVGTHWQNGQDMKLRDRSAFGERNGASKLTENQVREIRRRYVPGVITQAQLAKDYNVCQTTISKIVRGDYWKRSGRRSR